MARRPRAKFEDSADETSTVYGDMITFIMVLFILLFVLSQNVSKDETFFTKMRIEFGHPEPVQEKVVTTEELFVSQVQGFIEKEELEEYARVLVDEQKIALLLASPILFESGGSVLKAESRQVLNDLGELLSQVQNPIIIEGHTDSDPINTPRFKSNWELSFYRAYEVLKYFIHEFDYSPEQLSATGYGEYRPLVPNDSPENKAINRRIVINIIRITENTNGLP